MNNGPSVAAGFEYDLLVLQVENTLYPVYRTVFDDSPVFQGLLSDPGQQSDDSVLGCSREHPLKLEGVRKDDFKNFMRLFLPIRGLHSHTLLPDLTKDMWISVLRLSQMWQMSFLSQAAIDHLADLVSDSSEKLLLGDQYGVEAWRIAALLDLINREAPLSASDISQLDAGRAAKIGALRERRIRDESCDTHVLPSRPVDEHIVRNEFEL